MSREHVSAQIDRFDISLDQCPPPEWLPPNISVRKLDILKPLPEELLGQYDIVHVRLFICVIRDDDPVPVLTNLLKMLSEYFIRNFTWMWLLLRSMFRSSVRVFDIKVDRVQLTLFTNRARGLYSVV